MNERIEVTTYFLEMLSQPTLEPMLCPAETQVCQSTLTAGAYLKLYESVGVRWLWYERSELPINELQSLIGAPQVSIHSLRYQGQLAGYCELRKDSDGTTQILYFGLIPGFIGMGLGRYFLDWTVRHAFESGPKRVRVHTCSLDHPRALNTYISAGFREYRRESGWVTIPSKALKRRDEDLANALESPA